MKDSLKFKKSYYKYCIKVKINIIHISDKFFNIEKWSERWQIERQSWRTQICQKTCNKTQLTFPHRQWRSSTSIRTSRHSQRNYECQHSYQLLHHWSCQLECWLFSDVFMPSIFPIVIRKQPTFKLPTPILEHQTRMLVVSFWAWTA